jgi:sugar phosphate isomerase/epimerase
MTRRELLAAAAATGALPLLARARWDRSRISAINDEVGGTLDETIAFAHQYGLTNVEIRDRVGAGPRREYFMLPEPEIKAAALRLRGEGLKVSFLNTSLLKFTWPGMQVARSRPEQPEAMERRLASEKARFDQRMEDLRKAIACAQIFGCDKVRVFTGNRVSDPKSVLPRVAEALGEMAVVAAKEKIYLLIENEGSQNIAFGPEMAEIVKMVPSKWVALNWDPHNSYGKELAYPDGYKLLPLKRVMNIHIKANGVMPSSNQKEDWKSIMTALDHDDYSGKIGLETHIFNNTLIQCAHTSMEEILRIVGEVG